MMRVTFPLSRLARADPDDLWRRADECQAARRRVVEVAFGLPGSGAALLAEIDAAHAVVEAAERAAAAVGPVGARSARRALDEAYAAEKAVANRAGFESWSHFALRRIDALVVPAVAAAVQQAEAELLRAEAAWRAVAGDVDVEVAYAAREAIEAHARPSGAHAAPTRSVVVPAGATDVQAPALSEVARA